MELIDTHCHLDFPAISNDIDGVLERARNNGVTRFVVPGVSSENWSRVLELCAEHEELYPALGLHPCFLKADHGADLMRLEQLLKHRPELIAVGEIGLDLFIPDADLQYQLEVLQPQLKLAKEYEKPALLHVRKAHDQMLQRLRRIKLPAGGIVHAFSGSEQQAKEYLKLGFKLGIGGGVTYERARKLRQLVTNLPLDSFVLETDSPDMPLSGFQGQTNYPERVSLVLKVISELRPETKLEIARNMLLNGRQLLRI
ncbi:TatD family hydrolase [Amphritea sp. HPY]|uniref:TatD family hydrolase n=1 Tax=Amphritea sp. HPY TaxID=3421652 RepID=UPI003D7DC981